MIRLPKDVEFELKKKYQGINIKEFTNDLFMKILEKTFNDGASTIVGFGSFYCYKTFSSRLGHDVIRLKYNISKALNKSIKRDKYLLSKVARGATNPVFEETRVSEDGKIRRDENKRLKECQILGDAMKKTKKKLQLDEVLESLVSTDK